MKEQFRDVMARIISSNIIPRALAYKTFSKFVAQHGDFRLGRIVEVCRFQGWFLNPISSVEN